MEKQFQYQIPIRPKLDLIRKSEGLDYNKKQKMFKFFLKTFSVLFIFSAVLALLFSYKVISLSRDIFQNEKKSSLFFNLKRLILADDKKIKGENEGRTNILLLGIGGEGHEGAMLTDTIMIVSIKFNSQEKEVVLISIPRDLAIPYDKTSEFKINNLYAHEIEKTNDTKKAGETTANIISKIVGVPIHYYIRIDFEGFKKIIDSLGGIEIEVKNSFFDKFYPTENFGYQTIYFEKGKQIMDGEKTLQYVRSRHGQVIDGENDEASDFARAKRQQQALEAIKDKSFSVYTVFNPKRVYNILEALGDHVRTNLEPGEMLRLFDIALKIEKNKIRNEVIDNSNNGLLYASTSSYGAYILLPKNNDFSLIQNFVQNIFNLKSDELEAIKIIILNGTKIPNLAKKYAEILKTENYNIVFFGNNASSDYEKTVIYNKVKHSFPYTLKTLRDRFSANIALGLPKEIKENPEIAKLDWDMIIVLGENVGETKLETTNSKS